MKKNYWKLFGAWSIAVLGILLMREVGLYFCVLLIIAGAIANDYDRDNLSTPLTSMK